MSLRIPLTATRCHGDDRRGRFDYNGRCLTPEGLVLRRWQDRSKEHTGTRFDGCRLPPGTWRVLQACFADGLTIDAAQQEELLAEAVDNVRSRHPTWRAPTASKLAALVRFLVSRGVLERVLTVERDEMSPGIPDLFLYRADDARGVQGGRFVEVKRKTRRPAWKEPVSRAQRREHALLRSLGLRVSVVYIDERAVRSLEDRRGVTRGEGENS